MFVEMNIIGIRRRVDNYIQLVKAIRDASLYMREDGEIVYGRNHGLKEAKDIVDNLRAGYEV